VRLRFRQKARLWRMDRQTALVHAQDLVPALDRLVALALGVRAGLQGLPAVLFGALARLDRTVTLRERVLAVVLCLLARILGVVADDERFAARRDCLVTGFFGVVALAVGDLALASIFVAAPRSSARASASARS
jgi:hypothetical protein